MNNTLSKVIIFTAGAAIGSVVTWKIVKTKYEKIAQEEIDSVKETFGRRYDELSLVVDGIQEQVSTDSEDVEDEFEETFPEEEVKTYRSLVSDSHYTNESDIYEDDEEEVDEDMDKPFIIPPDEFGEKDGYDTVSLTYYSDGVLTDDCDDVIEDVDGLVGEDFAEHFGEYEDDSVFVRNDYMQTDYEILKDFRKFSEIN